MFVAVYTGYVVTEYEGNMNMGQFTVNNTVIHFRVCSSIYRICSKRNWGKYEHGTILQLII